MKKSLKIFLLAAFFSMTAAFSFSVEYGGVVSNNSALKTNTRDEFKLDQTNTLSFWVKAPVFKTETEESYFAVQGLYSFERDFDKAETIQYVDLELLKYAYRRLFDSAEIKFSAGRFYTGDLSGSIFTQKADGIDFSVKITGVELEAYAAYTGLLNANADSMLNQDAAKISGDSSKIYDLAAKNIVGILIVKFPSLFLHQTLTLQEAGAFSLESAAYTRLYTTAALSGSLSSIIYYDLCSTFGFTKYDSQDFQIANLSSLSLSIYPQFFNSSAGFNAVYASGNQGFLKPFRGITSNTFCNSRDNSEYSGMMKAGAYFTVKPLASVLVSGSLDGIFSAVEGTDKDEIKYKGIQFSLGADWQIFSDFMIGAKYIQYSDKDNSGSSKKQLAFNASLKF